MVSQMTVNMNLCTLLASGYKYSYRDYRERRWDVVTLWKV